MEWDYQRFGRWLRKARVSQLPVVSQDRLAELVGATQAKISRWELERSGTDAPTLDQCLALADLFEVDFIELATVCGRWNDRIERRILVALAGREDVEPVEAGPPRPESVVPLSAPLGRRTVDYGTTPSWYVRPTDNRPPTKQTRREAA